MPLHILHRPRTLKEIIGNRDTIAAIEAMFATRKSDFPHAILFHGPSGCGKTTLGRIFANMLGIADADLRELNIANLRGIDSARDIQEQMRLRPLGGLRRAWMLDEVHMSTREFQNAMLKALEDAPEHVFFILCTTDPQKLLKTILTRCHKFTVEALGTRELLTLVTETCNKEKVDVPQDVRSAIAENAGGSAREALVLLDSIIDMAPADQLAAVQQKAAEQTQAIDLCRLLMDAKSAKDWPKVMKVLNGLGEYDVERLRLAVVGYCAACLLKGDSPRAWVVMDAFKEPMMFDRNGRPGVVWACYVALNAAAAEKF